MTALIVTGTVIGIIILLLICLLFLPVTVKIKFKDEFILKILFSGIKIFEITSNEESNINSENRAKTKEQVKKDNEVLTNAKSVFLKLKKKHGFVGAVREIMGFVKKCFVHIKGLLKYLNIKKVKLDITVASGDAAKTALDYGIVCQAVYPVTSFLSGFNVEFDVINVKTDFESENCSFSFSGNVKSRVIYLIIAFLKIYKEYQLFITEMEKNERK